MAIALLVIPEYYLDNKDWNGLGEKGVAYLSKAEWNRMKKISLSKIRVI